MNIIILTSSGNRSGGSRQALYLAQGMENRGHQVRFFAPQGSSLVSLAPGWTGWRFLGPAGTWKKAVKSALEEMAGPTVIHAFHNAAVKKIAWWGLGWRKRAVFIAHRGVLFRPNNPLPYWSPGIDCFVVNSGACAKVLESIRLSPRRLRVVPNSVPLERLRPLRSRRDIREGLRFTENDLVFGTVAGASPVKGVDVLLRAFLTAFPAVETGRARLLVQGLDEGCPPEFANLPGMDRVRFLPHTNEVADSLAAMDCFVLPSRMESMPNTLLEAVSTGLPAIGSSVGAVPEILRSRGMTVPPGDPGALAQAMVRFAGDRPLRERLTAASLAGQDEYSLEKRLDRIEAIYAEFLRLKGMNP